MGPRKLQASGVHSFGWCQDRKGFDSQNIEVLVVVAEKVCCQERKGLCRQERKGFCRQERKGLGSQKEKASVEKKQKARVAKKEKDLADMKEKALTAMKERALAEMVLVARMKRLSRSKTRGPGV